MSPVALAALTAVASATGSLDLGDRAQTPPDIAPAYPWPNPGSPDAILAGCTCAVIDNHHGRGFEIQGELVFWFSSDCPVHVAQIETPDA